MSSQDETNSLRSGRRIRRTRRSWILLLLSLLVWAGCGRGGGPAGTTPESARRTSGDEAERRERGEQIVAAYLERDAAPYRRSRVRLTITSEVEAAKIYELDIWRKQAGDETLTLTHVLQPADESDLAALTVERKGEPAINITYASATGQFRETGTNRMFFGGLTTQELLGGWDKYDYSLLSERDFKGVKVYEVEGALKQSATSPIARFQTFFRADTYLPVESHLFNSKGEELRTFEVSEYRAVEGRTLVWRTEITNHVRQTKVTIEALALSFPAKANDEIFTREHLKELALEGATR